MSLESIGLVLQAMGVVIILISQAVFLFRVRRKWGSLKKAFLDLTSPRFAIDDEKLAEMPKTKLREAFKVFPLAKFLYDDFIISVVGLLCTLLGILLPLLKSLFANV